MCVVFNILHILSIRIIMKKYIIEERIRRLEKLIFGNNTQLYRCRKFEGGAAGHMSHIYDYTELTLRDVKGLIRNLFSGKIEATEKLDGMNIQCTMNNDGNVVFIRNKGNLNSLKGGMDADDVAANWEGKESIAKVYMSAYETIEKVFKKIGKKFFNPDKNTKILANCECITAGRTNILLYASDQVDFHNLWVYKRNDENSQWEKDDVTTNGIEVLEKACEDIDGAQLTPKVIIRVTEKSKKILVDYIKEIDRVFKDAGCSEKSTIDDYKHARFEAICNDKHRWITSSEEGMHALYNRWFNDDKSVKLTMIRKMYADYADELANVDYKKIVGSCMRPLDTFFSKLGNAVISLCDGIANAGIESSVTDRLSNDLEEIVTEIRTNGSNELKNKLSVQLDRLAQLGNKLNATEGIVFKYKDRLMKITGSFACVNQILGMRFKM